MEDEAASDAQASWWPACCCSFSAAFLNSFPAVFITPPTSSEREQASGKPKPQRASTACCTPSCKGFVFNDRIDAEPHCRYCGQAFNSTTNPQHSKPDRQESLAMAARLRAVGDEQTALRLEEIAPAPEPPNPTSPFEASQSLECRKKCGCAENESACGDGGQGGSLVGGAGKGQAGDAGHGGRAL